MRKADPALIAMSKCPNSRLPNDFGALIASRNRRATPFDRPNALARWQKQAVMLAMDLVLLVISTWLAYSLRVDNWIIWDVAVLTVLIGAVPAMFASFYATGVYRVIFRYVGAGMIKTLLQAFMIYGTCMAIYLGWGFPGVPRTLGILQPIVFFLLVMASRLVIR